MTFNQHVTMLALSALGSLLMLLLFARRLLVFPHIAVDRGKFKPLRQRLHYPARFVGGTIIGYLVYYFVTTLFWAVTPVEWKSGEYAIANLVVEVSTIVIGQILAAWMITMMSMEYRSQLHGLAGTESC